jgi:hypothetical protein
MKTPLLYVLAVSVSLFACVPARQATVPGNNRIAKPAAVPGTVDTIRWKENNTRRVIKEKFGGRTNLAYRIPAAFPDGSI